LGLLKSERIKGVESWDQFLLNSAGGIVGQQIKKGDMSSVLRDILGSQQTETEEALRWSVFDPREQRNLRLTYRLGLLPSATAQGTTRPPPSSLNTPIDLLANLLSQRLAYAPHERDSCLLHHSFELSDSSNQVQKVTASLLLNGDENASAMSVTVGKTLAFAAGRVLDGKVGVRGVTGPYDREVWEGVLDDLESVGVRVNETWS
jgi:alpha-aminoadipic semialdehyde synthase